MEQGEAIIGKSRVIFEIRISSGLGLLFEKASRVNFQQKILVGRGRKIQFSNFYRKLTTFLANLRLRVLNDKGEPIFNSPPEKQTGPEFE